jgi:hypothetical protein
MSISPTVSGPSHSVPPSDHERIKVLERISRTTIDEIGKVKSTVDSIRDDIGDIRKHLHGVVNGGIVKGAAASGGIFMLVDMVTKQLDKAPPIATTIVLSLLAVSVPLGVLTTLIVRRRRNGRSEPPPSSLDGGLQ